MSNRALVLPLVKEALCDAREGVLFNRQDPNSGEFRKGEAEGRLFAFTQVKNWLLGIRTQKVDVNFP